MTVGICLWIADANSLAITVGISLGIAAISSLGITGGASGNICVTYVLNFWLLMVKFFNAAISR